MVAAAFSCEKGDFMSREPFEAMPDVMDAKQLAEALQISKAGAYLCPEILGGLRRKCVHAPKAVGTRDAENDKALLQHL